MTSEVTYPVRVLREHTTELEAALSVCLAEPTGKAVHRLRTGTRRVEAQLLLLALMPDAPEHRRDAARLGRELRRLRRAAGEVRDFDVHRKHLEALLAPPVTGTAPAEDSAGGHASEDVQQAPGGSDVRVSGGVPASTAAPVAPPAAEPAFQHGVVRLRDHLQKKREKAALALRKLLTQRQGKAALAAEALLKALQSQEALSLTAQDLVAHAATVLQRDGLLAHPGPDRLDSEELHAVRKSAKIARYLAETLPGNPLTEGAARRMEAVQEAGGQWHDAVEITQAARKYLGKHHALTVAFASQRKGLLQVYRDVLYTLDAEPRTPPKGASEGKRKRLSPPQPKSPITAPAPPQTKSLTPPKPVRAPRAPRPASAKPRVGRSGRSAAPPPRTA